MFYLQFPEFQQPFCLQFSLLSSFALRVGRTRLFSLLADEALLSVIEERSLREEDRARRGWGSVSGRWGGGWGE